MKVLVVDDEPEVLDLLSRALRRDGHAVATALAADEAREQLSDEDFSVVVLDVALGEESGVELCRELRREGNRIPILLLTAHGEVAQRVAGFEAGADDFVPKPFAVAELRARVRALARRGPAELLPIVEAAGVTLDFAARRAYAGPTEVPITTREWSVLELLAGRRGRIVSRETILDVVWGEVTEAASASLDVIVGRIRRKLGTDLVRTVRGRGYGLGPD